MDILIPENIKGKSLDDLKDHYTIEKQDDLWSNPEKLGEAIKNAKAIIVRNQTKVDKRILDKAGSLLVIGRAGAGYDNIDVDYASKKGVVVCYTPDGNTIAAAELAISLMLSLLRKIPSAEKSTKQGKWDRYNYTGNELYGKTLGIVGYGKIGKALAQRAKAFVVNILVNDVNISNEDTLVKETLVKPLQLDELLSKSDIISLHLPSTNHTKNLFNQKLFNKMKEGSILINTSRGNVIVEEDLISSIKAGHIKGAALDVRTVEPPLRTELEELDNVILTPHIGGLTVESQERVITTLTKDVKSVLNGYPALNYLNFPLPK